MSPKTKSRTEKSPSRSNPITPQPSHLRRNWLSLVVVCCVVGVGVYLSYQNTSTTNDDGIACTMEAKLCPDGSYVGRTLPNCAFATCPALPVTPQSYSNTPTGLQFQLPELWYVMGANGNKVHPSVVTSNTTFIVGNGPSYAGGSTVSFTMEKRVVDAPDNGFHSIAQWKEFFNKNKETLQYTEEDVTIGSIAAKKMKANHQEYDSLTYYLFEHGDWFFQIATSKSDPETMATLHSFHF